MALAVQTMTLTFREQEQKKGSKFLIPGQLTLAQDVKQDESGVYKQRNGHSNVDRTTDTGSITTCRGLASLRGALVLQTDDSVFARDSTAALWRHRGTLLPAMPDHKVEFPAYATRPTLVKTGGRTWAFTYDKVLQHWFYRVTEDANDIEVQPATQITATGGIPSGYAKIVVFSGAIWMFYLSATAIGLAKFTIASPGTAPTLTTYRAAGGTAAFGLDVYVSGSNCVVAIFGTNLSGANVGMGLSYLNSATGLPTALGWVYYSGLANAYNGSLLRGVDGSGGSWYVAILADNGGTIRAHQLTVNTTTLVVSAAGAALAGTSAATASACGWRSGSDNFILVTSTAAVETSTVTLNNITAGTNTVIARGQLVTTTPFLLGSTWFVVTQHDDGQRLQAAYYLLRASDGLICGRTLYQEGGDLYGRGGYVLGTNVDNGWMTEPAVSGNVAYFLANASRGATAVYETRRISFDAVFLAANDTIVLEQVADGAAISIPGGWPTQVAYGGAYAEPCPTMYPRAVTTSVPAGGSQTGGTYKTAAVYVKIDGEGNMVRSTASAVSTQVVAGGGADYLRVTVPTLRSINATTGFFIEVYLSAAGGSTLFLARTVANDKTVDTINVDFSTDPALGEQLYSTLGGVIGNIAPPPHRVSFWWRDREFLTDTDILGDVWYSKQVTTGFLPEHSDQLTFAVRGGTGRVRAGGAVNQDYAVLFRSDAAFVISGDGLDDTGQGGNYKPYRLASDIGCENPRSVVTGPAGCYFQASNGGIYCCTGLQIVYVGAGVADNEGDTVTAAVHVPEEEHVRFYTSGSKCLVLDYGNATEAAPYGQWYTWTNQQANAACVANGVCNFVDSSGVVHAEVQGQAFDGASTAIKQKLQVAPISPAGLQGLAMAYRAQFLGDFVGSHTLKITWTRDFGQNAQEFTKTVSAGPQSFDIRPTNTYCTSVGTITIERTDSNLNAGFTFEGWALELGFEGGLRHLDVAQRIA